MKIVQEIKVNEEKSYEEKARQFFINEIFPSGIFKNFLKNETRIIFFTEKDEKGNLRLPQTYYNPHKKSFNYDANNQLSIENLTAVTNILFKYTLKETTGKSFIHQAQHKPNHIIFDEEEIQNREKNYHEELKLYLGERKKGMRLANSFLRILKNGKREETLFERTQKKLTNGKELRNNIKKYPPTHKERKNLESFLREKYFSSPLEKSSFEIQRNMVDGEITLPFLSQDNFGYFLNNALSILPEIQKLTPNNSVYIATFKKNIPETEMPLTRYGLLITNHRIKWKDQKTFTTRDSFGNIRINEENRFRYFERIKKIISQNPLIVDPLERKVIKSLKSNYQLQNVFKTKNMPKITTLNEKSNLFLGLNESKPVFAKFEEYQKSVYEIKRQMNLQDSKYFEDDLNFPSGIQIIPVGSTRKDGTFVSSEIYDLMDPEIDSQFKNNSSLMKKIYNLRNSRINDVCIESTD
jgi:hypothetical protein